MCLHGSASCVAAFFLNELLGQTPTCTVQSCRHVEPQCEREQFIVSVEYAIP